MLGFVRWLLAAALALFTPTAPVSHARASCLPPPFEVLWSYPADGANDVPVNTQLWFLVSLHLNPKVSLDGRPLALQTSASNALSATPELLQPNHTYSVVIEATDTDLFTGETSDKRIEHTFTTGSGTAHPLPYPTLSEVKSGPLASLGSCPKVIEAQDCFDTGQNTDLTFGIRFPERAEAWLVQRDVGTPALWPAGCGDPRLILHETRRNACYRVRSIGPGGLVSDFEQYCIGVPFGDGPAPRGNDAGQAAAASTSVGVGTDNQAQLGDASTPADASAPYEASTLPLPDASTTWRDVSAAMASTGAYCGGGVERNSGDCSASPFTCNTQSPGWWLLLALAITRLIARVRADRARTRRWAFAGDRRVYAMPRRLRPRRK